jgi:hypothetical protein
VFEALASLTLDETPARDYRLPPSTRSLLFVFGDQRIGAVATSTSEFSPGTSHDEVRLQFWAEAEARALVGSGDHFAVWYGDLVGQGRVRSVSG